MAPTYDINQRDHFNEWSETYERSFMQWLLFDRVHRGVLARVPADFVPVSVLDIGCGTGRLLRRMKARWPSAALNGVDLAEGMVAQARALTPEATIYQAPAEALPLLDGSVDLVTSTTSFHHWSNQAMGVQEAFRVLRPGGLFILADMNISRDGHPLSKTEVRTTFEAAGFTILSQNSPVPFFAFTVGKKA
jgi:ubiquinone/menaquinone biosynthesis C-methylase UbiE